MASETVPKDESSFVTFLERSRRDVLCFLRRLSHQDAEDLLQDTYAKVWRLRSHFDPSRNASSWLLRAAFHVFCTHRRRQARCRLPMDDVPLPSIPVPTRLWRLELSESLTKTLNTLPQLQRVLLLGFHEHGLSVKQLSTRHALPLNTVKSHLHRARQLFLTKHGSCCWSRT